MSKSTVTKESNSSLSEVSVVKEFTCTLKSACACGWPHTCW